MASGIVIGWGQNGVLTIRPDDGGDDLFAVAKDIEGGKVLSVWQRISFEPTVDTATGKPRARRVTLIENN